MTSQTAPLTLSAFLVRGEPIPYDQAVRGEFKPFRVGDAWGPPWSTTWFHVRGRVPERRAGRRVVAVLDLGFDGPTGFTCEALAWKDGRPWCGVDPNLPAGTWRSLVELDTPQVVVEAIKRAEDSDAVIVRLCEAWGEPCSTRLRTTLPAARAHMCDLLERNRQEIPVSDGEVRLDLAPFKILTLKLQLEP